MAATGIIRSGSLADGIDVSVVVSETHAMSAKATSQAIESGAAVTDHVIVDPFQLSVSCEVSNVGGSGAARGIYESFRDLLTAREPVEVITEHTTYRNMVILSLNQLHVAPFKGALQITAQLQQIRQAVFRIDERLEDKLAVGGNANKTAAAEVNAGKQTQKQVSSTLLSKTLGLFGGK